MTENTIEIDLSKTRDYEAGAILLAMLALPEGTDEARGGLIFSLCNRALRARFDLTQRESYSEQPLKPIYVFRTEDEVQKDLRTIDRRLRDRVIAADMAISLLKKATGVLPMPLPEGLRTLSLNELSEWAGRKLPKTGDVHDQGNIEARIWRPSLPVIHLAVAIATVTQAFDRERHGQIHPIHILNHFPLLEWIITEAGRIAEIIENNNILGRTKVPLLKITLRGS